MNSNQFPFSGYLFDAEEEEIVWIRGKAFVVRAATEEDIERLGKGYFALQCLETEDAVF